MQVFGKASLKFAFYIAANMDYLIPLFILALFVAPIVSFDVSVYTITNIKKVASSRRDRRHWSIVNGLYHAGFLFIGMQLFKYVADFLSWSFAFSIPMIDWFKSLIPAIAPFLEFLKFSITTPDNLLAIFAILGFFALYRQKFRELSKEEAKNGLISRLIRKISPYNFIRLVFLGAKRGDSSLTVFDHLYTRLKIGRLFDHNRGSFLSFAEKNFIAPTAVALDMWYLTPLLKSVLNDVPVFGQFIFVVFIFVGVALITWITCNIVFGYVSKIDRDSRALYTASKKTFSLGLVSWSLLLLEPFGSGYFAFDLFIKTWGRKINETLISAFSKFEIGNVDIFDAILSDEFRVDTTFTALMMAAVFVWYLVSRYGFLKISDALQEDIEAELSLEGRPDDNI